MRQKVEDWLVDDKRVLLEGWCRLGLPPKDLCTNMGIGKTTFYKWYNTNTEFANIIKKNKEVCDFIVENELFKNAQGFTQMVEEPIKLKEIKYDKVTGKKIGEKEKVVLVKRQIYFKPDTVAQIFWLKNRKRDKWRDKVEDFDKQESIEETCGIIEIPAVEESYGECNMDSTT